MWTIYSKNNCVYCDKAKYELKDEHVEVKNIDMNREWFTELLELNPQARTMPQIFRDGKLIGGYIQLKQLIEEEKLNGLTL